MNVARPSFDGFFSAQYFSRYMLLITLHKFVDLV